MTKTSEKEDTGFLSNVELDDLKKFHTASNSSKGGTAMPFMQTKTLIIERSDLNSNSLEYESTWMEI